VARTGNEVGLSQREWDALGDDARDGLVRVARDKLYAAGADYVIDTVAEVDDALDRIDERLGRGERP
jgi:phosphonoacetaldehyde hydrolase